MTPSGRTLAWLRERGWRCGVVERYNPHTKTRHDLHGFIDIIANAPGRGIVGVQATAAAVAARATKIETECAEAAADWIASGGQIAVFGWTKRGPAGARKLWMPRIVWITLDVDGFRRIEGSNDPADWSAAA